MTLMGAIQPPRSEVFRGAAWIWCGTPCVDVVNAWIQARREFRLARVPRRAPVRVTADARYRLWVNGTPVCRGPARGFQDAWPYDELDIAPWLRPGRNVVAALVHSLGISNFQYLHRGWAGFLLGGQAGPEDLATGPAWRVRVAPGYRRVLTRLSAQQGFQEHVDARLDDGRWILPQYRADGWAAPVCYPSGQMPWPAYEPRGIPLLREWDERPARLLSVARGRSAPDEAEAPDVVDLHCRERRAWTPGAPALRAGAGGASFEVLPGRRGEFVSVAVDFGHELCAAVRLAAAGAAGGEIVDVIACEQAPGGAPRVEPPSRHGDRMAVGGRVVLRPGMTRHDLFTPLGFRFLVVTVRRARRRFRLALAAQAVGYPLDRGAAFACSDARLTRIYEASVRTLQCCMLDAHVDCPWREQAQWGGDAVFQSAASRVLVGESLLFRRALRQIGAHADPEGLPYAVTPAIGYNHAMPDYALLWIMGLDDEAVQSGRLDLFRSLEPAVRRCLAFFARRCRTPLGLLAYPREPRFWIYLSLSPPFPPKSRVWYPTLFNLYYLAALESAARLYVRAGDSGAARRLRAAAVRLRRNILQHGYDRQAGALVGGADAAGRPVAPVLILNKSNVFPHDPLSCAWAVLLDLVPGRRAALLEPVRELAARPQPAMKIWMAHWVFEALKNGGHGREVIACIRRWWGDELAARDLTTTPEFWGLERTDYGGSRCHAWGAHPVAHVANVLLGIRPAAPAMRRVVIRPEPCGLAWARGAVRAPQGLVRCAWRRSAGGARVAVSIPRGLTATLVLPGCRRTLVGPARYAVRLTPAQAAAWEACRVGRLLQPADPPGTRENG